MTRNGTPIEFCIFTGDTDTNPVPDDQTLGRNVLSNRNAVVMMPKAALTPGLYQVSITASGTPYTGALAVGLASVSVSPPSAMLTCPRHAAVHRDGQFPRRRHDGPQPVRHMVVLQSRPHHGQPDGLATLTSLGTAQVRATFDTKSGAGALTLPYSIPGKPAGNAQGNPPALPPQRPPDVPQGGPPAPLPLR